MIKTTWIGSSELTEEYGIVELKLENKVIKFKLNNFTEFLNLDTMLKRAVELEQIKLREFYKSKFTEFVSKL